MNYISTAQFCQSDSAANPAIGYAWRVYLNGLMVCNVFFHTLTQVVRYAVIKILKIGTTRNAWQTLSFTDILSSSCVDGPRDHLSKEICWKKQGLGLEAPRGQKWKSWSWIIKSLSWSRSWRKVLQFFFKAFVIVLDGNEHRDIMRYNRSSLPFESHCLREPSALYAHQP